MKPDPPPTTQEIDPGSPGREVPETRRETVTDTIHGVRVADPYRWLENAASPDVQQWMKAQDAVTREHLSPLPEREALAKRFTELLYIEAVSAPYHRGGRYFYLRRAAKQEKAVLCWKDREDGEERVLVDPSLLSQDGSVSLGGWSPSLDGRLVAYLLHKNNADAATLYVRDIDAGKDLEKDVIANAKYASASWMPDSRGFYYTWLPTEPSIPASELPGYAEIRFHTIGTDPATDIVVHPALRDPTRFIGGYVSRDGRFLFIVVQHGWTSNDVYFKDLEMEKDTTGRGVPKAPGRARKGAGVTESLGFLPLAAGKKALYAVIPWEGAFYVQTNENAPRYRIFKVDPARPGRKQWREIVPQQEAAIDGIQVVGGRLIVSYLRNAASEMEVFDLSGKRVRRVELPVLGTANGMVGNPDEDEAYFSFSSFTQVPQIFRTSVDSGATTLWQTIRYPADTSAFTVEQVFYRSKDGTRVSMFLVHRKDLVRNGDNPVLLTGYGGFNVSETPQFSASAVVWLEHGGIFALPNLRGGAEYGEDWHRAGMLTQKQNVFDDFIAAAEFLVAEGYSRPERIAISGGSNGGLLVGAAMVQRPDLFRAVVCAVPLLDMVRYHLFGSGRTWVEEYGSAEDPSLFPSLLAYSPYHHLEKGTDYPALLVVSADSDDRVDPMHARKFTAAVQWATASGRPALLRIERHAGHGGADLVRQKVEQQADIFAFLFEQLRVRPGRTG